MPYDSEFRQPHTLRDALSSLRVETLRIHLKSLGHSRLPTRKADLLELLLSDFEDDEGLRRQWDGLDPVQKKAAAEAVYSRRGFFDLARFAAKHDVPLRWGMCRSDGSVLSTCRLGLFIHGRHVPLDLCVRLRVFVPQPSAVRMATVAEAPTTYDSPYQARTPDGTLLPPESYPIGHRDSENVASHDVLAVLRLVEAGKLGASAKTGRPSRKGIEATEGVLSHGDYYSAMDEAHENDAIGPIQPFVWPLLLQAGRLARPAGSKLQLTRAGKAALTAPPHETLRLLWERWLTSTLLDEFSRIDVIKGQRGKAKRHMTAIADRRATIVAALGDCPRGEWVAFDAFSRYVVASGREFLVSRFSWNLYLFDPEYGSLGYNGSHDWNIMEERYMLAFLFEVVATLGLLDVLYTPPNGARPDFGHMWGTDDLEFLSRYDGLTHIRLNPLGVWCLGLAEEYVPSIPERRELLTILPNRDVVATEPLAPGDRLALERFAAQTGDNVWRIDQERILAAIEAGASAGEFEEFLTHNSAEPLPQTVAVLFRDLADRATRLTDCGPARLIKVKDIPTAHLLANEPSLRRHCKLAGDHHLVVPEKSEAAFRRGLRKAGYVLPPARHA